jgi:hypothetical protein
MPNQPILRVNSPPVSHENIEGETMVIHFQTGAYYNLQGSALTVWEQLVRGGTREGIVAAVTQAWQGDPAAIRRTVSEFLDELMREELVREEPAQSGNGSAASNGAAADESAPAEAGPFIPPELTKYTDMQDFLLADPVHDTDEAGFPKPNIRRPDPA